MKNFKKPNYNCFNLLEFCPFVLNTELGPLSSLACVVLDSTIHWTNDHYSVDKQLLYPLDRVLSGPSCSKGG